MTVTITGSKYSGAITSTATYTLNNSGATFNSGDFGVQRIVGLWNSAGTTFKGLAWVRQWISSTQLELKTQFFDKNGNAVTQSTGDTYLVSKNFADVVTTGIAVSNKSVTITDTIVFGTSGSGNSLCFYDEDKQVTIAGSVTASNSNSFFQIAGGLAVFGQLEDYATFKSSHPISLLNQNTVSGVNGRGGICCTSTAAKFWWLGGSLVAQSLPMYLGETYPSTGSAGEWQKYWGVYSNGDFYSAPNGGTWNANASSQEVANLVSYAEGTDSINLRWGDGIIKGGTFVAVGSNPLSVFGSDVAGTYNIGATNLFTVINDCGLAGSSKPALWRSNNAVTQTINYINVITPKRLNTYNNGIVNTNATSIFKFAGIFTGLVANTLALVKNNNLLSTIQDSNTASSGTSTLTVEEARVTGSTETVTENSWAFGFYLYGYTLIGGTFATTTQTVNAGQTAKTVVFGGFVGQVPDVNLSQATVATVAAYTVLNTFDQLYDYAQYWKALNTINAIYPAYNQQLISSAAGVLSTPTALNLTIDTAATFSAANFVNVGTGTITVKPTSAIASGTKSDTFQLSPGKTLTFAQAGDKSGAIYLIPSTGIVVVASGATNLQRSVFDVGATVNAISGSVTLTVDGSQVSKITAGTGVTITAPQVSITAANFQQGTSVEVSRVDTYTLPATGINTSTGVITIAGHRFNSGTVPSLVAIVTQSGATLPTASTPLQRVDPDTSIAVPLLLSVVNVFGNTFQLATSDGGTPITFSSAGSGNFTVQGWTRLDFSAAGSSGYSKALTETDGATLQVKARYWQNASGCTASTFFQNNYIWSATAGITIPDTLNVATTPDTIHNKIIGATITAATSQTYSLTTDGSSVTGLSASQTGVVSINRSSGNLLVQDAYAWFVYFSSTSTGIRLVNNQAFTALDLFDFQLSKIVLSNANSTAVQLLAAYVRSSDGSRVIASGSNSLYLNVGQQGIAVQLAGSGGGSSITQQQIADAIAGYVPTTVVAGSTHDQVQQARNYAIGNF